MSLPSLVHARLWPLRLGRLPNGLPVSLARLLVTAGDAYAAHRAMRELMALNDHLLQDLGISRGDIPRVARTGRDWS